jgi:hypothetical protein
MKKQVSLILVLVVMVIFSASCKNYQAELSWYQIDGSGYYDETNNTSSIKVEAWLQIEDTVIADFPPQLSLVDWQFVLLNSDGGPVMQIAKSGYYQVVGDALVNTSDFEFDFLWVYIETTNPKTGDLFGGAVPTTMVVSIAAQDNEGNFYELQNSVPFNFTKITD